MTIFNEKYAGWALSLLRIVAALLFIEHGTSKLLDFPHVDMPMAIEIGSLPWIAGLIEMVGGALVLLGVFTRPVALILAGEMAVGYFMFHAPKSLYPIENGGDAAILFCFVFLLIAAAGPGPWSVEALRGEDDEPGVEGYAAPGGERQYRPEDFGDKVI